MRVSTILELLLIFLIIAFSAYGRVIERDARAIQKKQSAIISSSVSLKQATDNVNKYCVCNENICNCCRDFDLPLVKLPGPGCASLQYIPEDKLAMQLTVGDNILSTNIVNGKSPEPVCVKLPGGFSKFCGKVYNIQKEEDKHFKACLGLELQSARDELEATLRVSCFRFGPDGLKLRPAEAYPSTPAKQPSTASDDDYDDIFGLGDDDEDDEDDEDYEKVSPDGNAVANAEAQEDAQETEDDEEDDDPLGFAALLDIFTGGDDSPAKKKPKVGTTSTTTPVPSHFAIPILALSTQKPAIAVSKSPAASVVAPVASVAADDAAASSGADAQKTPGEPITVSDVESDTTFDPFEDTTRREEEDATSADFGLTEEPEPLLVNKVAPAKVSPPRSVEKPKVKKTHHVALKKKATLSSNSPNAIVSDQKKPAAQHHDDDDDDDDQDDDYDYSDSSDADDEDEDDSNEEQADHDDKHEESDKNAEEDDAEVQEYDDDDDDEDEEEDAVLSALVGGSEDGEKETEQKKDKKKPSKDTTKKPSAQHNDDDYDGIAELLARNHPSRTVVGARTSARQSKVMRL